MGIRTSLVKFLKNANDKFFSKKIKKRGAIKFNKENLYSWMNLTKKERFNLSKRDSMSYSIERKSLLKKIRNEYKNIIDKN